MSSEATSGGDGPARGEVRVVDGRELRLSSLDRVLWPATGFTKGDMLAYYERVAPALLAHVSGRPMTLGRFPAGVDAAGFAQTECRGRPEWMSTAPVRLRSGATRSYCLVDDLASLLWVANLGTVELHPLLGRAQGFEEPWTVVFDLDPAEPAGTADCAGAALALRDALGAAGAEATVKTSGSVGIHVFAAAPPGSTYDDTRALAREVARRAAAADERVAVPGSQGARRAGSVVVDWAQNSPRRSTIAPYSLRATDVPRVSAPVAWSEVEAAAAGEYALEFGPTEALDRVDRLGDLFSPPPPPRTAARPPT